MRRRIPDEPQFDRLVKEALNARGVELYDFSHIVTDERFFQDTDHLNRDGVIEFYRAALAPLLTDAGNREM